MAPLAYLSLLIAVWTLIELFGLPNQLSGGYHTLAERTNQHTPMHFCFFSQLDLNKSLITNLMENNLYHIPNA